MALRKITAFAVLAIALWLYRSSKVPQLPQLDPDPWWASGELDKEKMKEDIVKFNIQIPNQDIEDLETRINLPVRLPYRPSILKSNSTYGTNAETLTKFMDYWKNNYNWRERETFLNSFDHYKTNIEGLSIHFVNVKPKKVSSNVEVRPLLLAHGWPGSFVEFLDILPILTTPKDGYVFEVICPSIPGYAFSDPPAKSGLSFPYIGQIFHKLMRRLGHEKYYIQGGDWGRSIANSMAAYYPDEILGIHMNLAIVRSPSTLIKYMLGYYFPSFFADARIKNNRMYPPSKYIHFLMKESGYYHLQATRPDTIGVAVSDSPVSLASYLIEKFSSWTLRYGPRYEDGGIFHTKFPISLERMLDNFHIYWFTNSMTTSMRLYAESTCPIAQQVENAQIFTPSGFSGFPNELILLPESIIREKYKNLLYYVIHDKGGHFAAMERPEDLADDIFSFVKIAERNRLLKQEL